MNQYSRLSWAIGAILGAHSAGAAVSPSEAIDAVRAVAIVGYAERDTLKDSLGVVLAKTPEEKDLHARLFDLYFSRAASDAAKDRLVKYLETHSDITAAIFRDLLGASRKFAIALLDHFDHTGVTTRVGDTRRLRPS